MYTYYIGLNIKRGMHVTFFIKYTYTKKHKDGHIIMLSNISLLPSTLSMVDAKRGREFYIILKIFSDFKFLKKKFLYYNIVEINIFLSNNYCQGHYISIH